jgi:predicted Holliday junction resolvase-like endonuclease
MILESIGIGVLVILVFYLGYVIGKFVSRLKMKDKITDEREDAIKKSRAVLSGQFSEQLAPYMPDFPYKPTEARFIGKPIDFIVFNGMDDKEIKEVVFVEVKSGQSKITKHQKNLKEAIEKKKVKWEEYRIKD